MCLLLLAYQVSEEFPLILAGNRDEFYNRPTLPMNFLKDAPDILAGQDLEQGGTWFGLHKNGSFAGLTNYRDPSLLKNNAISRGEIIINFLNSGSSPESFINDLEKKSDLYNGFNLILGNIDKLFYFSNISKSMERIMPGVHGLSNKFLNTPWPKVEEGKKALGRTLQKPFKNQKSMADNIFALINDSTVAADNALPDTGISIEWERMLSARFIKSPVYGTRSSLVMIVDAEKYINITERTYSQENPPDYTDLTYQLMQFLGQKEKLP